MTKLARHFFTVCC